VLRRLFGSFCALWLAISIAEPALLHACPMHDGVTAEAGSGGHHAHGAADDASAPDAKRVACLCLGDCAAAAAVGLAPMRLALLDARILAMADAGLPDHAYVPVARTLLLPFANGPPSLPPSSRA
jgi:hypothetical protein